MVQRVAFAAGLALLAIVPANAASITTLYNTGVNNLGVATTGSAADLHWTLAGGPAYTGGVNGTFPIGPWVSDTATSRWVTPTRSARDANAVASYSYSTTFLLAGLSAASASFSGQFAADDTVTAIVLNGTTISAGGGGFSAYTAFASTGGSFLAGTNTLTLVTLNSGGGPAGPPRRSRRHRQHRWRGSRSVGLDDDDLRFRPRRFRRAPPEQRRRRLTHPIQRQQGRSIGPPLFHATGTVPVGEARRPA
jgi:hypothetical protein